MRMISLLRRDGTQVDVATATEHWTVSVYGQIGLTTKSTAGHSGTNTPSKQSHLCFLLMIQSKTPDPLQQQQQQQHLRYLHNG